ncbi:MAG TPA: MFS transporter [Myxococcales bacterium]|nr:MFS transporter [Myxococcales bacterium]HIK86174.1 MFS transporter [Myxococcales bacterium]
MSIRVNAPPPDPSPQGGQGNRRGWRRATESLAMPEFRRVFTSNILFFMAMSGQSLVRPWLAFELTQSPLALGVVSAAVAVPMLLLAPFGGVLADRMERRNLIVWAQALAIFSELIILSLLLSGQLQFWHLVMSAGMMGCAFPLIMPARQAIVVTLVGRHGLASAVALNMSGVNMTRVLGPAIAGFMIPLVAIEGVYTMNLSLYVLALLVMTRVQRVPPPLEAKAASISENLVEGFRYVWSNRLVLILLVYGLVPLFLAMPFQALLVVFAKDVWHVGSVGLGILNAVAGIGAVAGSAYIAGRDGNSGRLRLMVLSAIVFGALLAGFSVSPWFWPAVGLVFIANIFGSIFSTLNNTAIQLLIPDGVRGRISSFLMMSFSLPLLGTLPVAALAERLGAPMAVGISSLLAVIAAILFYLLSRDLRNLDERVRHAMAQD